MTRLASQIELPTAGGGFRTVELAEPRQWTPHPEPYRSRMAFAAAHVVADPWGENVPGAPAALDWDATLAFRRHLFSYGLGVAEAMDTAQRNMGPRLGGRAGTGTPQRRPGHRAWGADRRWSGN